jgi:RNA polymerase sigma-70 factor (ECF subfamily)
MILHACPAHTPVEDVLQETFIQAHRRLETLRDPARFGAWIYRIAMRICRGRRADPVLPATDATAATADADPVRAHDAAETRAHVRAAVASLPDDYRTAVVLRHFDGMTCNQIAQHLGEPVGTVWTRLHRANALLRQRLREHSLAAPGKTS